MMETLDLGDVRVDIRQKDVKHLRLTVKAPAGQVCVSAPRRMPLYFVRRFVLSKIDWIRKHRERLRSAPQASFQEFVDNENHWVWGRRYPLRVLEGGGDIGISLRDPHLELRVPAGAG